MHLKGKIRKRSYKNRGKYDETMLPCLLLIQKPLVKEHIEEMTESTPTIAPTFVPPEDKKKLVLDLKKINIGKVVKDTTEKIRYI